MAKTIRHARMTLSRLQKALLLSFLAHGALAVWLLPRVAKVQLPVPRGVVDLELIEPVTHDSEVDGSTTNKEVRRANKKQAEAPMGAPQAGSPKSPAGPIGDPQGIAKETDLFIQQVSRLVDQNKIYPKDALNREEEGKVVVALTLDRDGRILEAKVEQPSPFSRLNQAALQSVQKIGRFPAIPEIVPVPLHLHIPIQYRIER